MFRRGLETERIDRERPVGQPHPPGTPAETFDERMLFEAMRDVMQWLPQEWEGCR